jgi:hypothetical protein
MLADMQLKILLQYWPQIRTNTHLSWIGAPEHIEKLSIYI